MQSDIYNAISQFLRTYHASHLIQAIIDTSISSASKGDNYKIVPYLNLWAFNVAKGRDLAAALREVANTDDWGRLEDAVQEQGSSCFEISLQSVYPRWPADIDNGNDKIVKILMSAAKLLSSETIFLFHHIDVWPPIDLKTGKQIDLSLL